MICSKCGSEIQSEEAKFCSRCGNKLQCVGTETNISQSSVSTKAFEEKFKNTQQENFLSQGTYIAQKESYTKLQNFRTYDIGKSNFVTIVAWIFIVITGFSTIIAIFQNITIATMFPVNEMKEAFSKPEAADHMPAIVRFMALHMRLLFFSFLVLSVIAFISSIGLLKRKNWARIFFIAIMALGIIWSLGGIIIQGAMIPKIPHTDRSVMTDVPNNFRTMFALMRVFTAIISIGMSILFGWIIKKLVSKDIKSEFIIT